MEWNNSDELTPTEYHNTKASSLDGTSQYWSKTLPVNLITTTVSDWTSAGTKPATWTQGLGTYTWDDTEFS